MAKVSQIALFSLVICLSSLLRLAVATVTANPPATATANPPATATATANPPTTATDANPPTTTIATANPPATATDANPPAAATSTANPPTTATAKGKFIVEGKVYCDTCRIEFETRLSEPLKGAVVNLECRNRTDGRLVSHTQDVVTDESGAYKINVEGDHADEICEVSLVKSPRVDCNDPTEAWRKSRVVLTMKDGVNGPQRFANNLGFKKKVPLPECVQVLTEMGYFELNQEEEGHSHAP